MNMKNRIAALLMILILLAGMGILPASAEGATLKFSKSVLRPGDSFAVTLYVNLNGALTVDGTFRFTGPVTLTSITAKTGTLDTNGNQIFLDLGNSTVSGEKAVAVANFKINASAVAGETISVAFSGNYSNLEGDFAVSGTVSQKISPPLSDNCSLKSLEVSNAALSPAFSKNVTAYSAGEVPFSVSSLNIRAVAEASSAEVSISGNVLAVGDNVVTITVTAENGTKKIYTVTVTRQQDPNYIPSSDTALSGIAVEGFWISPPFRADTDTYIVWMPYETENITVTATPADPKASVTVSGGTGLQEGDNEIVITCTAEDGTMKEYRIIAKRAYEGGTAPETQPEPTVPAENTQPVPTVPVTNEMPAGETPVWHIVVYCIVSFMAGAVFVLLLKWGRKGKQ